MLIPQPLQCARCNLHGPGSSITYADGHRESFLCCDVLMTCPPTCAPDVAGWLHTRAITVARLIRAARDTEACPPPAPPGTAGDQPARRLRHYNDLIAAIVDARHRQGVSLQQLAQHAGCSTGALSDNLRGQHRMDAYNALALADRLGLDVTVTPRDNEPATTSPPDQGRPC